MTEIEIIKSKWDLIQNRLKTEYGFLQVSYDTWLKPLKPHDYIDGELILIVENDGYIRHLEKRYSFYIKICIEEIAGIKADIHFIMKNEAEKYIESLKKNADNSGKTSYVNAILKANLNPKYTFDTFVVGMSNNLAHAASVAVAESPGEIYNPLYIYGESGLGKTHLMHSIANFILKKEPDKRVLYVTSESFMNDFVDSIRNKNNIKPGEFRKKYREVDVLLIDDIQFIVGKEGTQEEFFHTFNTLYENKRQIVIASDKSPNNIDNLESRLKSRFTSGLTVDIQMPDYETRLAILRKKEELEGFNVDNEVIKYIAENVKSNIRELEGALNKLFAKARLDRTEITMDLAKSLLQDYIIPSGPRNITPELIISTVAEHYGLSITEISSQRKNREIVFPRQIAMYLCRELIDVPLESIGKCLGGRDHTTIMHGHKKISRELRTNTQLQSTIDTLKKKIQQS